MNALERVEQILNYLETTDYAMVEELVELTSASIATVRRDLKKLESTRRIQRFRGGVRLTRENDQTCLFVLEERLMKDKDVKMKIAKEAAKVIEDGDVIFMDAGSTVYLMIDYIKAKDIKVITNSIYSATKLVNMNISTYILGGEIPFNDLNVFSQETVDRIEKMNFDKVFVGTSAISHDMGMSSTGEYDAKLKSAALSRSHKKYLLADKSKFDINKMYAVSNTENIIIYTDYKDTEKKYNETIITIE